MNRRTFIKATGIVSLLGLTNLSFAEKEQQWIRMNEQMPKVGQEVILLGYCVPAHIKHVPEDIDKIILLFAERIEDFIPDYRPDRKYFNFKVKYLYSNSFCNREGDKNYKLHYSIDGDDYSSEDYCREDVKRIDKMRNVIEKKQEELKFVPHIRNDLQTWHRIWQWSRDYIHDNIYWIPADKYYSKEFPKLPKPVINKEI